MKFVMTKYKTKNVYVIIKNILLTNHKKTIQTYDGNCSWH